MSQKLSPEREAEIRANFDKQEVFEVHATAQAAVKIFGGYVGSLLAELDRLREQTRVELQALVGWDLNDDPHGYSDHYSEAVLAAGVRLGVELKPSTIGQPKK